MQIQCVYGDEHVEHIKRVLIPALSRANRGEAQFVCTHYGSVQRARVGSGSYGSITITDVENLSSKNRGFAENHNRLFDLTQPADAFVILNPDCIPHKGCIEALSIRRQLSGKRVAIVEGRQWPFDHPKEYDSLSLETPWASGAFALIDAAFYRSVGGMDPQYFLYLEDVDISWQAWLNGYRVMYEPRAVVTHFTGGRFYRSDLVSSEQFLSLRNFVIISKKFFGSKGESDALNYLRNFHDRELAAAAEIDYIENFRERINQQYVGRYHEQVKVLGLNCFHRMR